MTTVTFMIVFCSRRSFNNNSVDISDSRSSNDIGDINIHKKSNIKKSLLRETLTGVSSQYIMDLTEL